MPAPLIALAAVAAVGAMGKSFMSYKAAKQEARDLDTAFHVERLNAVVKENELRKRLVRNLSGNIASAGARGIALEMGTSDAAINENNVMEAISDIQNEQFQSTLRQNALRRGANDTRKSATWNLLFSTASTAGSFGMNMYDINKAGTAGGGGTGSKAVAR